MNEILLLMLMMASCGVFFITLGFLMTKQLEKFIAYCCGGTFVFLAYYVSEYSQEMILLSGR